MGTQHAGLLIIGASQAGVQLAGSLRALGSDEPITLVGEDNHRPYHRPPLSKAFLQGEVSKESLLLRSADYWDDHNITVVKNQRITRIEKNPDGSGTAHAHSGTTYPFDRLALAVGARARRLEVEGSNLPGVLYLRSADDALELQSYAPKATHVVVIGGGFIGLEAALSLRKMGKNVTVLEAGPRLVGRAVGEETSAFFLQAHRDRGVDVRLNAKIARITGRHGAASGVELDDGTVLPAQIVLVGIGVIPNTELAESLGLECGDGIRVDKSALASDGITVAVGDCANLPNPLTGAAEGERIRIESVNNAAEHAKVAANTITGRQEEYSGIPWFWSDQGDLKLQIAGLSKGYDRTLVRQEKAKGKFSVLYYRGDQIIAVDCVNAPLDFMAVKNALSRGANMPFEAAADPQVPLKTITTATTAPSQVASSH